MSGPGRDKARRTYPGEKARGGEIILRTPLRRFVFLGGLIGIVVVVLLVSILA